MADEESWKLKGRERTKARVEKSVSIGVERDGRGVWRRREVMG
jgi:hypothetical protein